MERRELNNNVLKYIAILNTKSHAICVMYMSLLLVYPVPAGRFPG